ncbi:cupin domain-containing protein [Chthonobacter albigriseus]|uniref:cupin domain-containing protein n=1 Tax=Chthonobacter albigriseus TaxID=1683161 RepID=UPI0015EEBD08|nr:cupin domain-containing protein [Chthonobacter albigriseus]
MDGFDVGGRLRTVREARGFSQRGLAKAAGISNATVSQIESNAVNPSVGALKRILDAIPMALSDFFAVDSTPGQVFFRASELKEIGRGGVSYRQVGKDLTGRALQLIMERYEAGADSGRIPLKHQGEEAAIILRGQLEVTVGDRREVLGPGDAYYFTSSEPHRFRNVGTEPCELVSACTPPSF